MIVCLIEYVDFCAARGSTRILPVDDPACCCCDCAAFKTGPNLPFTTFAVKCVAEGESCDAAAEGDGMVTGDLPLKPSVVEATVSSLPANNKYTCYVAANIGKFSKCIAADPAPGKVDFAIEYLGFSVETFTQQYRDQVCTNVLTLVPGGLCSVTNVKNGSAIVIGDAVYQSYFDAAELYVDMQTSTGNTTLSEDIGTIGALSVKLSSPALYGPSPSNYGGVPLSRRRLSRSLML